jgi:hypothetical protein
MAVISLQEPWRCCDICSKPFSAKGAYEKHLESGSHLKKLHESPPAYLCPDCNKSFSRAEGVKRHRTNAGQCIGGGRAPIGLTLHSTGKHTRCFHLKIDNHDARFDKGSASSHQPLSECREDSDALDAVTNVFGSFNPLLSSSKTEYEAPRSLDASEQDSGLRELDVIRHRACSTPMSVSSQDSSVSHRLSIIKRILSRQDFCKHIDMLHDIELSRTDSKTIKPSDQSDCCEEDHFEANLTKQHDEYNTRLTPLAASQSGAALAIATTKCAIEARKVTMIDIPSDTLSLISLDVDHAAVSFTQPLATASECATLSNMSALYGPKSLYQTWANSTTSQHTRSYGPELPGPFTTTVDSELRSSRRDRKPGGRKLSESAASIIVPLPPYDNSKSEEALLGLAMTSEEIINRGDKHLLRLQADYSASSLLDRVTLLIQAVESSRYGAASELLGPS